MNIAETTGVFMALSDTICHTQMYPKSFAFKPTNAAITVRGVVFDKRSGDDPFPVTVTVTCGSASAQAVIPDGTNFPADTRGDYFFALDSPVAAASLQQCTIALSSSTTSTNSYFTFERLTEVPSAAGVYVDDSPGGP